MNPTPGASGFFSGRDNRVGFGVGVLLSLIIKRLSNNNVIITIGKIFPIVSIYDISRLNHLLIIMVNNGIKYVHLIKSMIQLYIVDSIT